MALGEQADQQPLDDPILTDDDLLDLEQGLLELVGGVGDRVAPGRLIGHGCSLGKLDPRTQPGRGEGQRKASDFPANARTRQIWRVSRRFRRRAVRSRPCAFSWWRTRP